MTDNSHSVATVTPARSATSPNPTTSSNRSASSSANSPAGVPVCSQNAAACSTANARSPNSPAIRSAVRASRSETRPDSSATDSDRANVGTSTVAPTARQPARRDVTTTRPRPSDGRNGRTTLICSALSNTSSHRHPRRRSSPNTPAGSTPTANPNASPNAPICSATVSACSASTHHTASKSDACRCTYSTANDVFPTPPIPASATTDTTPEEPRSASASSSNCPDRPTNRPSRTGTFHTPGNPPGNTTRPGTARRSGGNGGATSGFPRPPDTASRAAPTSSARATCSAQPNRSAPTTCPSNPGRAQSATRNTSSLRSAPCGSAAHAACHSAAPYTDRVYASDSTATVRRARRTPSSIPATQFVPGTRSHACTRTRNPTSSNTHATHTAHGLSAAVYDTKKSHPSSATTPPPVTRTVSTPIRAHRPSRYDIRQSLSRTPRSRSATTAGPSTAKGFV